MLRYESYKPSGVKWIGDIPAHWNVRPGFTCFDENKDRNKKLTEKTVLSLSYGRIVVKSEDKMTGLVPESFDTYQLIKPGDIVIRTTDLQNDKTSLRVGMAKDKGMITSAYLGLRCKPEINPEYVFRLLESYDSLKVFYGMGSGLRQNIDFWDFKRLPLPIPSRDEQDRIVIFLDQKTADINAAIAKKKKLVELLQEQKGILINRWVTHGLNQNSQMQPSGIAWAGTVPTHWPIRYLKHIFKEIDRRTSTGQEVLYSLRMSGQLLRHHDVSDKPITADQLIGYKLVCPGQLVMNRMRASMGLFAIANEHGLVSPDYAVFEPIADIAQEYFLALFRNSAIQGVFLSESKGLGTGSSGFLRLYSDKFGGIKVPCPPVTEQKEIVMAIHSIQEQFRNVERPVEVEIDNLQEMRSTLIAAAVTGQIKV